jgi:hypothetical protein
LVHPPGRTPWFRRPRRRQGKPVFLYHPSDLNVRLYCLEKLAPGIDQEIRINQSISYPHHLFCHSQDWKESV